ncbi:MAG: hypothetical protein P2A85_02345 [Microcoleus anatoxicus]|uniref:hypothetical protein n=1 Tax=Microcoleus anatoxicus TaxID=2705319 RepID=UPI003672F0A8
MSGRFTFALNQNITTLSAPMICYAPIASQFLTLAIASTIIFSSLLVAIAIPSNNKYSQII